MIPAILRRLAPHLRFLHKYPSGVYTAASPLFIYWDRKASVLEFNLLGSVYYLYIPE